MNVCLPGAAAEHERRHTLNSIQASKRNSSAFRSGMPIHLKRTVFGQLVLPALTHGCETWILTEFTVPQLVTAQYTLGYTAKDRKRSEDITKAVTRLVAW